MEVFKATVVNELERMCKRKKVLMTVILSLLAIVIGQIIVVGMRSGFGVRGVNSEQFPLLVLAAFSNVFLPLFTALLTIDTFCGEISHKTISITVVRPVTRFKIFSAKILSVSFFVFANLLIVMILSIISGFLFNSTSLTIAGILRIIVAYFVTLIPMVVFLLIVALIANVLKSGTAAFFLSILVYIFLKALGVLFLQYSSIFIVSMLDWYNLWTASVIPLGRILRQFLIMLGCGIMLYTAGFCLFDKKDF